MVVYTRFCYKNKVYKNIRLQWHIKALRKIKERERCFLFRALVRNFHKIKRLSYPFTWFLTSTENYEVQFEFLENLRHARESFTFGKQEHVKNIFRLETEKKLKTSEGFIQFQCSYKKKRVFDGFIGLQYFASTELISFFSVYIHSNHVVLLFPFSCVCFVLQCKIKLIG